MKKLNVIFGLLIGGLLFSSCMTDEVLKVKLAKQWDVSFDINAEETEELDEAKNELKTTKEKIDSFIDSLDFNLTINQDGEEKKITNEDLKSGISKLAEGLRSFADGIADLGKGLKDAIADVIDLQVELKDDGQVKFINDSSSKTVASIEDEDLQWAIENEKFVLSQKGEKDKRYFEIMEVEEGFNLVGEGITLKLRKTKSE